MQHRTIHHYNRAPGWRDHAVAAWHGLGVVLSLLGILSVFMGGHA